MINVKTLYLRQGLIYLLRIMNEKLAEIFTLLHPPAKLCYALIVQHDVGWSARVQIPYICHLNSARETPFCMTF